MTPYFEWPGGQLWHGNCREILPTLPLVDVCLTDPPYSEITHAGARSCPVAGAAQKLVDFQSVETAALREYFNAAAAITRSWLVSFMNWRHVTEFEKLPPNGCRFVRFGIWDKPDGAPQFSGDRPATGWEAIAIMHKTGGRMVWNGGGRRAVWTHGVERGGFHPTGKPVSLMCELALLFSRPGDTILDPFTGSGSTAVACLETGRHFAGCELSERYCEITAHRIQERLAQGRLFEPQAETAPPPQQLKLVA